MAKPGGWTSGVAAGLLGLFLGGGAVAAFYGFNAPDRAVTERIVRDYILEHGEILPEAMNRLERRRGTEAVARHRAALERPFHGAWAGAADGDVTLVYFFDYACIYCHQSNPDVARLLAEDPRLKLVWRELPVLGPASEEAAIASMSAARAGRFRQFHDNLFRTARPTPSAIAEALAAAGIGPATVTDEHRREIQSNTELARALGGTGTPIFVVGDQVLQGAVGYQQLKNAIAQARRRERS